MKITHTMVVMFVGSFTIQYFLMSPIMVNNRVYITNNIGKVYMSSMIEHHSMGLLTSEEILKKSDNYDVVKIAKNIIQTQTDEIRIMRELLV